MWKYLHPYLGLAFFAVVLMAMEILMDLYQPAMMSRIVDEGVLGINNSGKGSMEVIVHMGLKMLALTFIGCLCGCLNNICISYGSQKIGNAMRKDCFQRIMSFSFHQAKHFGTGTLITRMTNDITQVQGFLSQFVRGMVRTLMLTFGSIYFMFRLHSTFGLMALAAFPFIAGVIYFCLRRARPLFPQMQRKLDALNDIMQEDVASVRMIKSCVREAYEKVRFGKANDRLLSTQLSILFIFATMNPTVHFVLDFTIALLLLWGNFEVSCGVMTPGLIMAALTYITTMMHGILILVMVFQTITRGRASWERIEEILDTEPELSDGECATGPGLRGKVEFRNVSFTYPDGDVPVLSNINLTISPGESVAIMGSTGSGKSTLINLIPRFYDVTEGQVLVAGRDVREYRQKALRRYIAYALQKTELFSDTIRANVMWGEDEADQEQLELAARIAQASDFIAEKDEEWDEVLDERGNSISGGQKQRLGIARAVLREADIFIFDDATSALDLHTEAKLSKALREAKPDSTKIVVAQRVASARGADRIVVLDNGKIVGNGKHEELIESCQTYRDICDSQLGRDDDVA